MRAVVNNSIAVFYPQGFLDGINSQTLLTLEDIAATEALKVDMVLVSLKKVIFFNRNGLDTFIKMFVRVRAKNQATVGFCDVDTKKYSAIKKFYEQDLNFSIFKTKEIAALFAPNFKNEAKKVLIYSSDKSQRAAMAIELHDNGHNPIIAQT
ncbi:MAG: chemotaxis protein CheX, partial [Sulfurimonadaceae bacterium]